MFIFFAVSVTALCIQVLLRTIGIQLKRTGFPLKDCGNDEVNEATNHFRILF